MSFTVTARVGEDGRMVHGQKNEVALWLKAHRGEVITATFEKKRKPRSHDQLQWLFGVAYPALAKEAGYDDHELHDEPTLNAIHEGLLQRRYGVMVDKVAGTQTAKERTTGKTAAFVSEYMEWVSRFAATEYRMDIALPDEWKQKAGAR